MKMIESPNNEFFQSTTASTFLKEESNNLPPSKYELPLSGDRNLVVGLDPAKVSQYFGEFMLQHYDPTFSPDKTTALQAEVLNAMSNFYYSIGDIPCYNATGEVIDNMVALKKSQNLQHKKLEQLSGSPSKKENNKRKEVAYDKNIEYCFTAAKTHSSEAVKKCIGDIVSETQSTCHCVIYTEEIPQIFVGECRCTVLSGNNPNVNKSLIYQLVTTLNKEKICTFNPQCGSLWDATNQAFLKEDNVPYAIGNFLQGKSKDVDTVNSIQSIIDTNIKSLPKQSLAAD